MLFKGLTDLPVTSRQELIANIYSMLGSRIERVIDTHNTASVIFIYSQADDRYLLKAELGSDTATHREIAWYRHVEERQLSRGIELLDSFLGDDYALLLLNYVNESVTIDELAARGKLSSSQAVLHIQNALNFDHMLFSSTATEADAEKVDTFFGGKYERRRREAQKFFYLAELLNNESIIINGRQYSTPDVIMNRIQSNLYIFESLIPKRIGLIHGDLHCGNILTRGKEAFFIDPNGNLAMPIEYDIGKILHSIHGNYGSIMRGEYSLIREDESSYRFTVNAIPAYETALEVLKKSISKEEYIRGLYAEALHFATMLPHHVSEKKETTALFLQSVLLFNELMSHFAAIENR